MTRHGFLRVAAAMPKLRVADCAYNTEQVQSLLKEAEERQVAVVAFPELSLTGYTCGDLFQQIALQQGALQSLAEVARRSAKLFSGLAIVGLPLAVDDQLFNCAAVLQRGKILGFVPKSFIPNYKEFYERRWFAGAATARSRAIQVDGALIPFGTQLLFEADNVKGLTIGVEICEDLWVPIPPSSFQALHGATLLVNLSASNEVIGKSAYRRDLVQNQSGRCVAGYLYSAAGVWESTTDVIFGGHSLIAENGVVLAEAPRFVRENALIAADVDLERLCSERMRMNSFGDAQCFADLRRDFTRVGFSLDLEHAPQNLLREVEAHPFVPSGQDQLRERCQKIFNCQVAGLAKRLEHIGRPPLAIGISGGLDSTLALLVACKTLDALGVRREHLRALTLPAFGTTSRTRDNARALIKHLAVSGSEIDIRELCLQEMAALGHQPFGIDLNGLTVQAFAAKLRQVPAERCEDLVFENVQARMRTSILMNSGFVVGTSDLSELALGWTTYNGDHMSMYNPNVGIPKTLVKFLVQWVAQHEFEGESRRILLDVVATEISPELLPTGEDGKATQATERVIGPYELLDFFLFHFLRYGEPPEKILYLAEHAQFSRAYSTEDLGHWLAVFLKRFFANQFKRSCLPDGPKVGSVSLSPRGDWRMPSDAQAELWLRWLEKEAQKTSNL